MQLMYFVKKNIFFIVAVIVLIVIQAIGIILLPQYISKIVDTGIQKKGIEYSVPIVIRKSEMDKLMIFINDEKILENFQLISNNNDIKGKGQDQLNVEEPLYIEKENIDKQKLNYTFARAITLLQILNKDESIMEVREKVATNITKEIRMALGGNSVKEVLESLDKQELKNVNKAIDEKMSVLTEDVLDQLSSSYLANEYEKLGLNGIQERYISINALQMFLIAIIVLVTYILGDYLLFNISATLGKDMREGIFNKIINIEECDYDRFTITTLVNRSVYDVQVIQQIVPLIFKILIFIPIICIGSMIKIQEMTNYFNISLVISAFIILVIGIITYIFVLPKINKAQKILDKLNLIVRDTLNNIFIARGSGQKKQVEKFNDSNEIFFKESKKIMNIKMGSVLMMQLVIYILSVYILWTGGIQIEGGTLMLGALMAIIEYLFQISFSVISILRNSMSIFKGINSFKRYKEILEIKETKSDDKIIINNIENIQFKNVYFRYPNTNKYILEDFSTTIQEKDKISLLGKNGIGKSTVWKLLLGLYQIEKGEILVNGINLNKVDLKSLRKRISVISQTNYILRGNINSNILLDNTIVDKKEIQKLKDVVELNELEDENMEVLYKGKNLSGGQKQRIAIARTLATNADMYIFDSAFSSVDQDTKKKILNNLKSLCKEKIIINIETEKNDNWKYNKYVEL